MLQPALSRVCASRRHSGYTLIELLIVLAIIATLASIAVPGWRMYSARARRTEALVALKTIHDLQIAFFAENDQYANSFLNLGFDLGGPGLQSDGSVHKSGHPDQPTQGFRPRLTEETDSQPEPVLARGLSGKVQLQQSSG